MSAATGTERVLAPGAEIVLEVVRVAVNERCPILMPTLYSGLIDTETRPFGTLDATWLAFQALANTQIPAASIILFACFFVGRAAISPVGAPACR